MNFLRTVALGAAIGCFSPASFAGFIELNVLGEVRTSSSTMNEFGLNVNDSVSLTAIFDDAQLTGLGAEQIPFLSGSGNTLALQIGQFSFSPNPGSGSLIGMPVVHFLDGIFNGVDYFAMQGVSGAPADFFSLGTQWAGRDQQNNELSGLWDIKSAQAQPAPDIPEPAPLALAILGLFGAWVASRREKSLSENV